MERSDSTRPGAIDDGAWRREFRRRLLRWFDRGHRDLPWRRTRDPYAIWVSEVMLQQTTVEAVAPYWERFLEQFPTIRDLARAPEADVLKAWEGLGYYRRARHLHAAAQVLVRHHGGVLPNDPEAVRALPGVGRYMTGAVLSIAFDRPIPILETNVMRVLTRVLTLAGDPRGGPTNRALWTAAERLVAPRRPGAFNQALMELGAQICTPRQPACLICPVRPLCRAAAQGTQARFPELAGRPPIIPVDEACAVVRRSTGRTDPEMTVLIARRGTGGRWPGMWEFPRIELARGSQINSSPPATSAARTRLIEAVPRLTGITARIGSVAQTIRYSVTHHRIRLRVFDGEYQSGRLRPDPEEYAELRWESPRRLAAYAVTGAARKLIQGMFRPRPDDRS